MINENELWATVVVDELVKHGVKYACIGAGSRSTPLTLALAQEESIVALSYIDERTAAFAGLGIGMQSDIPAVVVCTSGTALANFYPAVLEAYHSNVPLIIFSADRPPELRGSGANQTMDQIGFFRKNVLYFQDIMTPDPQPMPNMIRYIRTQIGKAISKARFGPVHLNFPFRKPLEPNEGVRKLDLRYVRERINSERRQLSVISGHRLSEEQFTIIRDLFSSTKTVIILGPTNRLHTKHLVDISLNMGIPILADPGSSIRFLSDSLLISSAYESMEDIPDANTLIILGQQPVSNVLLDYIDNSNAKKVALHERTLYDSSLSVDKFIKADVNDILHRLSTIKANGDEEWIHNWKTLEKATREKIREKIDSGNFHDFVIARIFDEMPPKSKIFIGNSLSIRLMSKYVMSVHKPLEIYTNRGLSGIDGNVSTTEGLSISARQQVVAILGDLTFYHDSNALLNIKKHDALVKIIILNNRGGGIFDKLPIHEFNHFEEFFRTPHEIQFEYICNGYGIEYLKINDRNDLNKFFNHRGTIVGEIEIS